MNLENYKLIIIRGIPGSGKSTLALKIMNNWKQKNNVPVLFEADQYFYNSKGKYVFDMKMLGIAHRKCIENSRAYLMQSVPVIIANTFLTPWEINTYLRHFSFLKKENMAAITLYNDYGSIHNIPEDKTGMMCIRFKQEEKNVNALLKDKVDVHYKGFNDVYEKI